jgi:hypothetical protein
VISTVDATPLESKLASQQVQEVDVQHGFRIVWVKMRRVKHLSIRILPPNM